MVTLEVSSVVDDGSAVRALTTVNVNNPDNGDSSTSVKLDCDYAQCRSAAS